MGFCNVVYCHLWFVGVHFQVCGQSFHDNLVQTLDGAYLLLVMVDSSYSSQEWNGKSYIILCDLFIFYFNH